MAQMGQTASTSFGTSADTIMSAAAPVVTIAKTYDDGHVSRQHSHDRHQLIYATSGLMMAETQGATWAVPAGYGLTMPAGTLHGTRFVGCVRLQSLYLRPDALTAGFEMCRILSVSPLLAQLIAALCALDPGTDAAERAYHLSSLILMDLARAPTSPLALPMPSDPRLTRICDALIDRPDRDPGIDHWAGQAGLSRRAFTRGFRAETGMSFGQWGQRLRAQRALQALAAGRSRAAVARDLGYGTPSALSAMMRRLMPAAASRPLSPDTGDH